MDSIEGIEHPEFSYIFIPSDVEEQIQEIRFAGTERNFKEKLRAHFSQAVLKDAAGLKKNMQSQMRGASVDDDVLTRIAADSGSNYQIIPLTLPTKANGHLAVNAYIDDVGAYKGLPVNVRASHVTSDAIKGDCFLSRTFDDEDVFKRIDFSRKDYEDFMRTPPSKQGRWDPAEALKGLQAAQAGQRVVELKCNNCNTPGGGGGKELKRCSRCQQVWYCNVDCQKADWKFHKRVCKAPS
uniref:MYND-type domain-containing protein n=1 Tax=Chromera velia CCMP2878 TaxID=1169474 RepID=A0A0G4G8D9_9ALVE|mmetsp:Transcript_47510/g.93710  ORF Transcript_47510/g.93710 Transcript_47510/m.93710 type:complete len:239 (+) Transcript_47510:119-835(+)|eukprot:Cvel_20629.t1-p1 / transcript=Cvel_20629.t1 / gene=Cvel_20629 / organism=Chromera_velia_CCMP2878 / gene_product=SET domain-containing protein 14, putative / transcript_product=SET domain-containing protein 14, putative / location=Cvel_scaffold1869:29637-31743(-) / protein_length=238 / sequence_SO=supercontig / SO=protein_coding / is_pseudo=false